MRWQPTAGAEHPIGSVPTAAQGSDEGRSDIVPDDGGVVTESRPEQKLRRPPMYKVLLHNDDFTTREFVVEVLRTVFHHPEPEAVRIMLHVHQRGVGVAGVFTYEVAEMKMRTVEALARQREFPLMLSLEPADD